MAEVKLVGLEKEFGDVSVIHRINLDIADGEFAVLVEPSGCGKTATLRMVAGLDEVSGGSILFDGKAVERLEPKDRDIAMVFQSYALYPHMSVRRAAANDIYLIDSESGRVMHPADNASTPVRLAVY